MVFSAEKLNLPFRFDSIRFELKKFSKNKKDDLDDEYDRLHDSQ